MAGLCAVKFEFTHPKFKGIKTNIRNNIYITLMAFDLSVCIAKWPHFSESMRWCTQRLNVSF